MPRRIGSEVVEIASLEVIGMVLASLATAWLNGHKVSIDDRHGSCFYTEGQQTATTTGDSTGEDD